MSAQSDVNVRQDPYADPAQPGLPKVEMKLDLHRAALVITDPQIDFLSPNGVTWKVVGDSVQQHGTVENIGRLLKAAKQAGITVTISPHFYYPYDRGWKFGGPLEVFMQNAWLKQLPGRSTSGVWRFESRDYWRPSQLELWPVNISAHASLQVRRRSRA